MGEIIGAIIFYVFVGVFFGTIAVGFIGEAVLTRRYKKFYETTEEGKKLYCALYTKDRLGSKHDWLVNQMRELRDRIDEFESYFPDERDERAFLHGMKVQYREYSEELAHTKEAMENWQKRIDEMVAALPKKYKGILKYNWELAKVSCPEEVFC